MCSPSFINHNKIVVTIASAFSSNDWNAAISDLDAFILINLGFHINGYVFIYVYACILL